MKFQDLFLVGMKRELPEIETPTGLILNLGAGNTEMLGTVPLDYPSWDATRDPIPYGDGAVDHIFAFHFLEHLSGVDVIRVLREAQRVLRPGGTMLVVVPHRLSQMAFHDLDHKSFWCEETWRTLFSTPYYDKNRESPWKLRISFNLLAGLNERNLALFTQLVREP